MEWNIDRRTQTKPFQYKNTHTHTQNGRLQGTTVKFTVKENGCALLPYNLKNSTRARRGVIIGITWRVCISLQQ